MSLAGSMRAVICTALVAVLLAGCSSGVQGGQTPAQATEAAAAIPGVASADVVSEDVSVSPFDYVREAQIRLSLESGWSVDDAPGLLRWALTTGGSLNDEQIDGSLALWLDSPEGHPDVDWQAAASAIGIADGWTGAKSYAEHGFLLFWPDDIAAVVDQPWPADPPPVPQDAFAPAS